MSGIWAPVIGRSYRWEVGQVRVHVALVVRVRRVPRYPGGCRFNLSRGGCQHGHNTQSRAQAWISVVETVELVTQNRFGRWRPRRHTVTTRDWRFSEGELLEHRISVLQPGVDGVTTPEEEEDEEGDVDVDTVDEDAQEQ